MRVCFNSEGPIGSCKDKWEGAGASGSFLKRVAWVETERYEYGCGTPFSSAVGRFEINKF